MKWGPTHSWMIMNGHEYCVCSAAMWPQGGELGPLQFPLLISNNSPQDLWKLDFWHLHMTEQWHNWTKPFQGFRQHWNWWYQMLYVSQLDVWVYVYVYMCVFFLFIFVIKLYFNIALEILTLSIMLCCSSVCELIDHTESYVGSNTVFE